MERADADGVASGASSWQWLNPRGGWQDFKPHASQQLEAASARGKATCRIDTPAGAVTVNFRSMLQSREDGTHAPRKVRRLVAGTEQPPETTASTDAAPRALTREEQTAVMIRLAQRGGRNATAAPITARQQPQPRQRAARSSSPAARGKARAPVAPATPRGKRPERPTSQPPALPEPAPRGRRHIPRPTAARGSGGAAARALRNGNAFPAPFPNDEALALWLSTQENLSDEDIARIYEQHYNRRAPVRGAQGDALDIDRMSYEELQALCERMGDVERSKPSTGAIAALPTRCATALDVEEESECAVCVENYEVGDEIRILPCFHEFHKCCIDRWFLSGKAGAHKCPMCNAEVEF